MSLLRRIKLWWIRRRLGKLVVECARTGSVKDLHTMAPVARWIGERYGVPEMLEMADTWEHNAEGWVLARKK